MAMKPWGGIDLGWQGDRSAVANLQVLARAYPAMAGEVLAEEYGIELEQIRLNTPFDTDPPAGDRGGELQESGQLLGPTSVDGGTEVILAFGGPDVPYAIVQHQADYDHAQGERMYVEDGLRESAPFMASRIVRRLQARIVNAAGAAA